MKAENMLDHVNPHNLNHVNFEIFHFKNRFVFKITTINMCSIENLTNNHIHKEGDKCP
jgi:hypothetical protein